MKRVFLGLNVLYCEGNAVVSQCSVFSHKPLGSGHVLRAGCSWWICALEERTWRVGAATSFLSPHLSRRSRHRQMRLRLSLDPPGGRV